MVFISSGSTIDTCLLYTSGPKEQPLQAGDKVRAGGAAYVAQHAAAIYVGAEKSHWWGILRLEREGLV